MNDAMLEELGIVTKDTLMGLIMSTESAGIDDNLYNKAIDSWERYYNSGQVETNFNWLLCHLICKADSDNLFRLSKGYPEMVRVFAELNLKALSNPEKVAEVEEELKEND